VISRKVAAAIGRLRGRRGGGSTVRRLAIVTPASFGDSGVYGGGERYSFELARALSTRVETRLVALGRTRSSEVIGALRVETYPPMDLHHAWRSLRSAIGIIRHLLSVDVIHCQTYSTPLSDTCILIAWLTGKKIFVTHHGGGGYVTLARIANLAGLCTGLLLVSEFSDRVFKPGRAPRRVIYGGVNTAHFRPSNRPKERRVVFIGRLLPHKGLDFLLEGIPADVPLVIVGRPYDPAYLARLRALATGKDVTFVTDADDRRVLEEYQRASVSVLPSVYDAATGEHTHVPELLGLVLLEAMACGTAVVCTDVGGMPEIVEDGVTGFVVPPNDALALSDRIDTILETPSLAETMGSAARERVLDRFTWECVATTCMRAYGGGPQAAQAQRETSAASLQ
jgi:glycosyltransferase involved in cell wall biosynthesis